MNGGAALWVVGVGLGLLMLAPRLRLGGCGLIMLGLLMLVPPPFA